MRPLSGKASSDTFELSVTEGRPDLVALPAVLHLVRLLVAAGETATATELMAALRAETQALAAEPQRVGNLASFVRVETRGSMIYGVLAPRALRVSCDRADRDVLLHHVAEVALTVNCAACATRTPANEGAGACYRVTLVDGSELRHARLESDVRFVSMAGLHSVAVSRMRAVTLVRKETRAGWLGLKRRVRTTIQREVAQPGDLLRISAANHTSSSHAQEAALRVIARHADQITRSLGADVLDALLPPLVARASVVRLRSVPPPA